MKKILLITLLLGTVNFDHIYAQPLYGPSNINFSPGAGIGIDKKIIFVPAQILLLLFGNETGLKYGFNTRHTGYSEFSPELTTGLRSQRMSLNFTNTIQKGVREGWNVKLGFQIIDKEKNPFKCRVGVIQMHKATGGFVEGLFQKDEFALTLQVANLFGHNEDKLYPYASIGFLYRNKIIGPKKMKDVL